MTMREDLRLDLAWRLGLKVSDVLTRQEAATLAGVHPNVWTNFPSAGPNHYRAARGHTGINFYDRRHIETGPSGVPAGTQEWEAKWFGKTLPWPPPPTTSVTPTQINTRAALELVSDDPAYINAVMTGRGYP